MHQLSYPRDTNCVDYRQGLEVNNRVCYVRSSVKPPWDMIRQIISSKRLMPYGRTWVAACLVLLSIACAGYVLAAPGGESPGVSVYPTQAYTGDPIEISLRGFPGDYLVPAGVVSLAGVRVSIPGTFDNPGVHPRTDSAREM